MTFDKTQILRSQNQAFLICKFLKYLGQLIIKYCNPNQILKQISNYRSADHKTLTFKAFNTYDQNVDQNQGASPRFLKFEKTFELANTLIKSVHKFFKKVKLNTILPFKTLDKTGLSPVR